MDLSLLFTLSLCWWTAAARSYWSDQPKFLADDEIKDGETVEITCTLPIDYSGGECRLYREGSRVPFRVVNEAGYLCVFYVYSGALLGREPVGSRVYLTCDYHLQEYTSMHSQIHGITVTGTSPSPRLSVSRRLLTPDDKLEVTCFPPLPSVSSCSFYKDDYPVAQGSCSRNLTGKQLSLFWEKPATLVPVNLTCRYFPHQGLEVRSESSNHNQLFVLDVSRVSTSMNCSVTVEDDQLEAFRDRSWTSVGADGQTVTVHVTNRNLTTTESCNNILP
ncbi:uncharacterized protein LOC121512591 [Cheilinus undulatus]|uniref:uncharacterized protein LOC121512591 n=1 Tax=Cheilinus undulatus TaxID=241271 RepID=UPI001BD5031C|nr:uncharacterized protein LOC121512591 [Cheilinus undulatus]